MQNMKKAKERKKEEVMDVCPLDGVLTCSEWHVCLTTWYFSLAVCLSSCAAACGNSQCTHVCMRARMRQRFFTVIGKTGHVGSCVEALCMRTCESCMLNGGDGRGRVGGGDGGGGGGEESSALLCCEWVERRRSAMALLNFPASSAD
ncbi:unnamed protein product [Hydatigera taeniaeformis]|uniref:PLAC domain-containing protein n=1 Tax=Hydatigena taeniaeformis TaxID=6205 RepID=A0A0R3XCY8_HYDTA|nr:unnamed protein product [Hydatigera taeniaeformis]